jgi:hypothetical protein
MEVYVMPKTIVFENIPFQIELSQLTKELHIPPTHESVPELEQFIKVALALGRPEGIYHESSIREKGTDFVVLDGVTLQSRILRINLDRESEAYPFIVTCGRELDEWCNNFKEELERFWAGKIAELALDSALKTLKENLKSRYHIQNIAMMNPGSLDDWPIEEQPKLFRLLGDVKTAIGVELTGNNLMKPVKSISGIFFANETNYENCRLCPRKDCPGRRAAYDQTLCREKYHF